MDILSHGLWGGIVLGRKNRKMFWSSFFFGIMPDLFSFGVFFVTVIFGFFDHPGFGEGHPSSDAIPQFVYSLYNLTHSLVVFILIFAVAWFVLKKFPLVMLSWPIHIIFDIFTHTKEFFPTPFLWPLADVKISIINWGDPRVYIPNVLLLIILYVWFFIVRSKLKRGVIKIK